MGDTVTISPGEEVSWPILPGVPLFGAAPKCNPDLSDGYWGGACEIFADEVRLMYFPVTGNVSRDTCTTAPTDSPLTGSWDEGPGTGKEIFD